ncbi:MULTISPECIES: hypothetical protein [Haloferax]|uniref:Uncharacterized protein n=2 Tax=Haloferax TaxID=2251 RepID=A0A6G1YZ74_9EURY|nr:MULTISPECIES: hypothetical protein [Haloferax]KAB1186997.1 hypothetical protein Hfx1149_02705 [Haloferax sp. CBA1149]MRW79629.1 hypothetical protein [Haloferax marinisediminis]
MEPLLRFALVPGHVQTAESPFITVVVVLAGIASVMLAGLGVAVFYRRQTRSHLLIALALLVFASRACIAGLSLGGVLSSFDHHIVEHGLDFAMASLVLAAIYYARKIEREAGVNEP